MARLPLISWKTLEKIYELKGYEFSQQKGSHRSYVHKETKRILQLVAAKEIPRGTLSMKIRHLELTRSEFLKLLAQVK